MGTGLKEASRKSDAAGGTLERFPSCDYPGTTQAYSLTDSLLRGRPCLFSMPSLFQRKKSSTNTNSTTAAPESQPHPLDLYTAEQSSARSSHDSPTRSAQSSPEKKSRSSFVRERGEKDKKSPRSPRGSSSFAFRKKDSDDSHPLNLPPEELRRLSALRTATMGSPREEAGEPMQESTPAPQQAPGAFPNGVNGDQSEETGPAPPPHRSATSSPAQQSSPTPSLPVDAEACKEAGNKFFKAKQYDKAIEEYTKGSSI